MKGHLLIDGSLLAYRCHEALSDLSSSDGIPTGLEYGFLRTIESLERKYPKFELVIVWDGRGANDLKRKICPEYKGNRRPKTEEDRTGRSGMWTRVHHLRKAVLNHVWPSAIAAGLEADDVMYLLTRRLAHNPMCNRLDESHHVLLYTNDQDMLQCVGPHVTLLKSHRSTIYEWDADKVFEKFKVWPEQLPLLRACLGDKSDNLPGCGCLNSGKLAEAVRNVWRYCGKNGKRAGPDDLVEEMTGRPNWFSPKAYEKWIEFVESGQLNNNYDVMQLDSQIVRDFLMDQHTSRPLLKPPFDDMESVAAELKRWEIRSLRLSSKVFAGSSDEEEF